MDDRDGGQTLAAVTMSVSIRRPPDVLWDMASDVAMWPRFLRSVRGSRLISSNEYHLTTRQGTVVLRTRFDRDRLLLDHLLVLPVRSPFHYACRLVPNYHGSELVASVIMRPREADSHFRRRVSLLQEAFDDLRHVAEGPLEAYSGYDGTLPAQVMPPRRGDQPPISVRR
ncbi:SRPBCC family protein [Micromonospora sediminicola]|uniref:SRPBCC family protein n=1 Tax=Micromonospora sediminicola TaxID=946078 RepID=UPI001146831D|nr:SRPBCC family protein [Micromonospora sediminicola]